MPGVCSLADVSAQGRHEGGKNMTGRNRWSLAAGVALLATALAWPVSARAPQEPNPTLVLETSKGTIEIELLQADAPRSVEFIVGLVNKHFYRGLRFHRAERTLVQVGDPTTRDVSRKAWWGRTSASPGIGVAEIQRRLIHVRGTVALAHGGDASRASSQFYIMKEASPSLNGKYTIIGRVRVGMPVVDTLAVADILKLATIKKAGQTE
jgi:cyclophilin family peptidyl-prolyl cis-trans isomerase